MITMEHHITVEQKCHLFIASAFAKEL